jgi:hypothetical protein
LRCGRHDSRGSGWLDEACCSTTTTELPLPISPSPSPSLTGCMLVAAAAAPPTRHAELLCARRTGAGARLAVEENDAQAIAAGAELADASR